ncbi:MAG: hypothetical protein KDD44_06700, partial [Bdellovibrionales bacterium]|nr:hypothetical protein [Bdellovibrionales bacterium]
MFDSEEARKGTTEELRMPQLRRLIKSGALYELGFRARKSLPFPCTKYMQLIFESALARVQRDSKVVIHGYLVEGGHVHLMLSARDADQCRKFYGELQKALTDAVKRLLGRKYLNIWEGRVYLAEIPTLEDAINKFAYIFGNPAKDDQESSVDRYPGISSWAG